MWFLLWPFLKNKLFIGRLEEGNPFRSWSALYCDCWRLVTCYTSISIIAFFNFKWFIICTCHWAKLNNSWLQLLFYWIIRDCSCYFIEYFVIAVAILLNNSWLQLLFYWIIRDCSCYLIDSFVGHRIHFCWTHYFTSYNNYSIELGG